MKHIVIVWLALLFVGCSPKYRIVKTYHPPKSGASSCLQSCELKLNNCKSHCEADFNRCKIKADQVAQKAYEQKLQSYHKALEAYASAVERYNMEVDFAYVGYYGDPFCYGRSPFYRGFFYDPFWYSPRIYLPPKPKKPSLEQEKLKAEGQMCRLDCGCQEIYDRCFSGCGGEIEQKKVCIENCPNEE